MEVIGWGPVFQYIVEVQVYMREVSCCILRLSFFTVTCAMYNFGFDRARINISNDGIGLVNAILKVYSIRSIHTDGDVGP